MKWIESENKCDRKIKCLIQVLMLSIIYIQFKI